MKKCFARPMYVLWSYRGWSMLIRDLAWLSLTAAAISDYMSTMFSTTWLQEIHHAICTTYNQLVTHLSYSKLYRYNICIMHKNNSNDI